MEAIDFASMFYDDLQGIVRVLLVGILAYAGVVILLRISGQRTLSKMSAFDFVVTIALGSTLSSIIISGDVALAEGMLALAVLIFLQWCVAWLSAHSKRFYGFTHAEPVLLVSNGEMLKRTMRRHRIAHDDIMQAIRDSGQQGIEGIDAIIMENNGSMSVISKCGGAQSDDTSTGS